MFSSPQFIFECSGRRVIDMAEQANATLNISDDDMNSPWDDDIFRSFLRTRRLNSFIIYTLILGVIIVVGIIGNCLTFVVFWKGNFKSSTSFLFLSLSLIDSVFLIAVFTMYSVVAFVVYTGWLQGYLSVRPFLIVYGYFIFTTKKTATIWVTVLVAVNRYIIVCRPLRAPRWCTTSKVKIQLAVVLVLAVVINIPALVQCRIKYYSLDNGTSYTATVDCGVISRWRLFYTVYHAVLNFVLWMGVPLFILTLLTIRLITAMKAHRRMQLAMNSLHNQPDNNMTFALVMVVIMFIICHGPEVVLRIVWMVVPSEVFYYNEVWYIVLQMSRVLMILNSAVNFIIYTLANKRFREVLITTICRRHTPTEGRVLTARQMARAEVVRDEPDDDNDNVNDTPL